MQKAHQNINWENLPSTNTPLNQTNLNSMDQAIDTIDNRVVAFDTSKANQTDMLIAFKGFELNTETGVITVTRFDNSKIELNTNIQKIAMNMRYDSNPNSPHYQQLILSLEDGTEEYVDLSVLINEYEFETSDTIVPTLAMGKISMDVRNGSITPAKLRPDYLADITVQAENANTSAVLATDKAVLAQSWAEGGTETREDEDTNNSKYFAEVAADTVASLLSAFGISVIGSRLIFGTKFEEQYGIAVSGTTLIFTETV